ncbi:MAG: zinc ABC transporter substrate-binding protein [Treponema sp.]|nr:zinc ABC transporter substrate-binding protein [Treponema sp.]
MKLRKILAGVAILFALSTSVFAAKAKKLQVVTTIFPEYDWVREILGDNTKNVDLTLLVGNGVDLHSYQPSIQDIAKISTADIFIYVGGESDGWVKDALANATNKKMKVINLMEVLEGQTKAEEMKEGMQASEHHHHHHEGEAEEHEHNHEHHEAEAHEHHHDDEITEADIKARKLSEFNGEWQSLYPVLKKGALEEYVHSQAEKKSISEKDSFAEIEAKWNCGVKNIVIKGNKITFIYDNGKKETETYKYAGFATKTNDEGKISSIRYKFESKGKKGPKYVMLNDHGHEPADSVAHFHIYFGNKDFDELLNTTSNPFFVASGLNDKECLENLMGHDHGHNHEAEGHDHDEHDHDHEAEEGHHHHHHDGEVEYDEHVWLSVRFAKTLCAVIADALCDVDSANASVYKANLKAYSNKLDNLDSRYAAVAKNGKKNTLLFGDRFPFRYFVEDYNLDYFAAFVGCSAETEASFETVAFLSKKLDELGLNTVLKIESGDGKIARTIVENSKKKNAKILTLDSIQSTTLKQAKAGTTYLKIMEDNLKVIEEALK